MRLAASGGGVWGWSAPAAGRICASSQPWGSLRAARSSPGLAPRPKRVTATAAARSRSRLPWALVIGELLARVRGFCSLHAELPRFRRGSFGQTSEARMSLPGHSAERMRRFYEKADVAAADGGGFAVRLDGRQPRSPRGHALVLPTEALARLVA